MPYFIYKITPQTQEKKLEYVCDFPQFRQAKQHARSLREQLGTSSITVKIIFADSGEEAEARLLETRSAPILKEWEK